MKKFSVNCKVNDNNIEFNNSLPMKLVAGPCQIESRDHAFSICSEINEIASKLSIQYIYKSSFDKANR